jgi:hypothetical protein
VYLCICHHIKGTYSPGYGTTKSGFLNCRCPTSRPGFATGTFKERGIYVCKTMEPLGL